MDLDLGSITIDLSNYGEVGPVYTIDELPFSHPSGMWTPTEPFVNGFPEWEEFNKMCKEYPGLEKVYEHMKAYYNMCKDDWESKKREDAG